MLPTKLLADVAVRASIPGQSAVFTYQVPPGLQPQIQPGQLVWVPLRRQQVQGIVLDLFPNRQDADLPIGNTPVFFHREPDVTPTDPTPIIRDLIALADREALLTPAQLRLARWICRYYQTALYDALELMLPPGVMQEAEPTWRATALGMQVDLGTLPERERAILYLLRQRGELSETELRQRLRGSDADLREAYLALHERGLLALDTQITRPKARPKMTAFVRLAVTAEQATQQLEQLGTKAHRQHRLLSMLLRPMSDDPDLPAPEFPLHALLKSSGATRSSAEALQQQGLISIVTREVRRDPLAGDDVPPDLPPALTLAQERVWRPIAAALEPIVPTTGVLPSNQPFLLHGITGSGKTEIYLRAIGRALRLGKQALVVVPEIALTTQLVRRFAARFPGKLAVLHSGLGLGERYDEWRRLRRGEAQIAIGSRSAVFAPLPQLGLIILDEEHEPTFKHDSTPRYHAREAALQLAQMTNSVLILGSATPSLESYYAAREGHFRLLELHERVGMVQGPDGLPRSQPLPLPPVQIVDMRHELQAGNRSIFSRPLQQAISRALDKHEQVILYLNRRGAATFVMCRDCGHVLTCARCSSPLAVHYDTDERAIAQILRCHSCGHSELMPSNCPACWSPRVKSFGVGTQRVVEEIELLYPTARTVRWDRDTAGRKGDHGRMLDLFLKREADVLVGTQMIAKGLDLPQVTVVGAIAADTGLHLPDFRSGERTFQLLTQVAGRAGRRSQGSQVVIQTYTPEHYALRAAQEHDYHSFYQQEIAFRRTLHYPPFSRMVRFVYASSSDERCRNETASFAKSVEQAARSSLGSDWGIIGPAPTFFYRQRGRYRWHLLLRAPDPLLIFAQLTIPAGWTVDVDPINVL